MASSQSELMHEKQCIMLPSFKVYHWRNLNVREHVLFTSYFFLNASLDKSQKLVKTIHHVCWCLQMYIQYWISIVCDWCYTLLNNSICSMSDKVAIEQSEMINYGVFCICEGFQKKSLFQNSTYFVLSFSVLLFFVNVCKEKLGTRNLCWFLK